jgi:hypothetical protein
MDKTARLRLLINGNSAKMVSKVAWRTHEDEITLLKHLFKLALRHAI